MEKLKELFDLCKATVHINYNENLDLYLNVEDFLAAQEQYVDDPLAIDAEVRKIMVEKNQMITIQAFPNTPIGFFIVYHWDLEAAVNEMLDILKGQGSND